MATKRCTLALSILASVLLLCSIAKAEVRCKVDVGGLVSQCLRFVSAPGPKQPPSPGCCAVVKKTDINCACLLLGIIPVPISMDKVCYVASVCQNPLKPGTQCHGYTVPASCT